MQIRQQKRLRNTAAGGVLHLNDFRSRQPVALKLVHPANNNQSRHLDQGLQSRLQHAASLPTDRPATRPSA